MAHAQTLSTDALMRQAIASHKAGQHGEAQTAYRAVIAADPGHAEAHHNLGVLMMQGRQVEEGLVHLARALQSNSGEALYYVSHARGLLMAGKPQEAAAILEQGRRQGLSDPRMDALQAQADAAMGKPQSAAALDHQGSVLLAQGRVDDAIAHFRKAVALAPDFAQAHYHLGSVLSEHGAVAQGFAHFMRRAELVYEESGPAAAAEPEPLYRARHDAQQREYLGTKAGAFVLADGSRIAGPAVNPANATPALAERWRQASPRLVVLDDFLTAPALARLRAYCTGSTIWRKNYPAGYLGAAPEDGFACPLLAQIVEEIQSRFRPILQDEPFRYLGAFKYDSEICAGTNTHADNSALNVNFYIAPDEANLDPDHGGMEIWDVAAPDVAAQRRLSSSEEAVRDFLKRAGAKSTIIPHRANRAVIFHSGLFHRTDKFTFRSDYLSRRVNISLLFGQLGG